MLDRLLLLSCVNYMLVDNYGESLSDNSQELLANELINKLKMKYDKTLSPDELEKRYVDELIFIRDFLVKRIKEELYK